MRRLDTSTDAALRQAQGRIAHSNGFAVRPGIRTVVCLAAIACRQRATRRSRVGTLPQADPAGGSRSKSAIPVSAQVGKSES